MFLLTKLDEALILYKRKSGGSSSLVRRKSEGSTEEEGRKNMAVVCDNTRKSGYDLAV